MLKHGSNLSRTEEEGEIDILRKTKTDVFTTRKMFLLRETAKGLLQTERNDPRSKKKC